ncbi:MAG: polymer-forming cytoskeletal protein [Chloroflexota bacterium]
MSFFTGRRSTDNETDQDVARVGFDTVLSASTVLEGTLKSEGNIRLDGHFTGKLDITGNVLVGESAEINADIEARNISIAGIVRGNVIGNKVQLLKTGRIWGDIQSNSLTTEEGAFIDGSVTMNLPTPQEVLSESDETDTLAEVPDTEEATTPSRFDDLDQTSPDLKDSIDTDNSEETE